MWCLASANSFIAAHQPDSGTAGVGGRRDNGPVANRGRQSRQGPPRSPAFTNRKESRSSRSLGFSLMVGREGEGAGTKAEGRGSGVRE